MKVSIRFFALYRELTRLSQTELDLEYGTTAGSLTEIIEKRFPSFKGHTHGIVAVNSNYVGPDFALKEGDEISYFPPFSGGTNG